MYAIVEINGQQFKAEQGKKLFVHHIKNSEEGQAVEFDRVLLVDADGAVKVGAPTVEGAKVTGKVLKHGKNKKIKIFKYVNKNKSTRKSQGHRQPYTKVEITKING